MASNTLRNNREMYDDLLSSVEATLAAGGQHRRIIECGPIEVNCFSICFWAKLMGPAGMNEVYVKIPKVIFYDKEKETLGALSGDDIKLAVDEHESLVYLSRHWDGDDIGVTPRRGGVRAHFNFLDSIFLLRFDFSYGTFASASKTFIWPGIRPATGCIPYFTSHPFSSKMSANSRT